MLIRIYFLNTFGRFRWCSEDPKFWSELMSSQSSEMSSKRVEAGWFDIAFAESVALV